MSGIPIASGSDWDDGHLKTLKVNVTKKRSFSAFFGVDATPEPDDPDVLEFLSLELLAYAFGKIPISRIRSSKVRFLVKDVIAVTKTHRHEEAAVHDMSRSLLHLFGYDDGDNALRTRTVLDLFTSQGKTQATPDVIVERLDTAVKLLVQEDKSCYEAGNDRNLKGDHPETNLVAGAIAAYQENVRLYERKGRDDFPDQQLVPGIVMLGTCPTFYLIPVTKTLADCVRSGDEPEEVTEVKKFIVPTFATIIPDAILDKEACRNIAQCLHAFKRFIDVF